MGGVHQNAHDKESQLDFYFKEHLLNIYYVPEAEV